MVGLKKACDRVPRTVIWWALRKQGVDEWLVRVVQALYSGATSKVRIGTDYTEEFNVNVGVHQGSVLSPLLFIVVLQSIAEGFKTGPPWELLYADHLVLLANSIDE
ncbi:uncharacterized protein LOC115210534, partial [Argonauta hians]